MKTFLNLVIVIAVSGGFAACAATKRNVASAATTGKSFEGIGRVAFHRGQPCASQIMFDFDIGLGSTVWLAANENETKSLTEAARRHRRVRVAGTWRKGKEKNCGYVSVKSVSR
jgi:hypothetical protein